MKAKFIIILLLFFITGIIMNGYTAGTLTPKNQSLSPLQIKDHQVHILIQNGFAQTEVYQTFLNPNATSVEGVYSFPLPKSASLSEVTVFVGENEIHGEVLPKKEAKTIYEEEKNQGNEAGHAEKKEFYSFEFSISRIPANGEAKIRFLYYQPIPLDTGIGHYVYPLEEGGTDEACESFWLLNDKVEGSFSVSLELKSAWPIHSVRVPGLESDAQIDKKDEGHYLISLSKSDYPLNKDFVFYYRLADNLPGRIELIPYKPSSDKEGTFMMVVTPGLDLQPIKSGADYTFVLDTSGSMQGKIHTLIEGVKKVLQKMNPDDRFRIITFNDRGKIISHWKTASLNNIQTALTTIDQINATGSTNLYDGLQLALNDIDTDRVTSIVLVTDGVTNTGEVNSEAFYKLMRQYDIRVFGFLLGNASNWPLMQVICDATGGFYKSVSNQDDILGQILLAKSKILHESLHDATLKVSGVKVYDTQEEWIGKIYRGQQLILFGHYKKGGKASITLKARLSGQDKTYQTEFDFPDSHTSHPEIERLWALNQIELIQSKKNKGLVPCEESAHAIRDIGVSYQIVTDETSMIVLSDECFTKRNIERSNQKRIEIERTAKSRNSQTPAVNYRVDNKKPAFQLPVPSIGGGGAFDPCSALLILLISSMAFLGKVKKNDK